MPIVQPGQVNLQQFQPQTPGPNIWERLFSGVGSGVQGVIAAMQERDKLEREKQEFESKQAYFKTLDTGNKLDNEKKKGELRKEQRALESRGAGLDAYQQWIGGGGKQEGLGPIVARIKDPDAAQDFINRVTDHYKRENEAAIAAKNQADAEVAAATKEAEIGGKKAQASKQQTDADVAAATQQDQIANAKAIRQANQVDAQTKIAAANAPPGVDPNTINAATNMGRTFGLNIGDAFKGVGATLPPGIDPAAKGQQSGGMGAADKRRNEVATTSAKAADMAINQLITSGVRLPKLAPLVSGKKLGNLFLSDEQQQLVQANKQFGQMYALFVTGQAASDPLLREINMTVTGIGGEKEGVLQQQAVMRQVVLQAMQSTYGQGKPASQTLLEAAQNARDMGVDTRGVKFLQKSAMDATNAELKAARDQARSPLFAPSTQWQPMDYDSVMGAYNFGGTR
jgi:hypothetical protein